MDLRTYQQKAVRTNKWLAIDNQYLKDLTEAKANITVIEAPKVACRWDSAHFVIGMFSEINEIMDAIQKGDTINLAEEIADVMWYTVNEATVHKVDLVVQTDLHVYTVDSLAYAISAYADFAKKEIIYLKARDEEERAKLLQKIVNVCYNFSAYFGNFGEKINLPEALEKNIAKLMVRYPEKYTDTLANNRDLIEERKALEN